MVKIASVPLSPVRLLFSRALPMLFSDQNANCYAVKSSTPETTNGRLCLISFQSLVAFILIERVTECLYKTVDELRLIRPSVREYSLKLKFLSSI